MFVGAVASLRLTRLGGLVGLRQAARRGRWLALALCAVASCVGLVGAIVGDAGAEAPSASLVGTWEEDAGGQFAIWTISIGGQEKIDPDCSAKAYCVTTPNTGSMGGTFYAEGVSLTPNGAGTWAFTCSSCRTTQKIDVTFKGDTFKGTATDMGLDGEPVGTTPITGSRLSAPTATASLSVTLSLAKARAAVGDEVAATVTLTAGGEDLTDVSLGLRSSSDVAAVSQATPGLSGLALAAGSSRSFAFTVTATNDGTAALRATASGTASSGTVRGGTRTDLTVTGGEPAFDYTMPPRYQDAALTESYAQPKSFTVVFTVRGGHCDTTASYSWFSDGNPVTAHRTAPCVFEVEFDKLGTYTVRVEQSSDPSSKPISFTKEVVVQDFLVAAVGDSLASGEGSPPYTGPYECDRSQVAYDAQAAKQLEAADPRSSVTFLQLACSGANMEPISVTPGPLGAAARFSASAQNDVYNQLLDLKRLVGDRKIDALTLSVGINDVTIKVGGVEVGFAKLVALCVTKSRCQDTCVSITDCTGSAKSLYAAAGIATDNLTIGDLMPDAVAALPDLYDQLAAAIAKLFPSNQLDPADVYLVGYPDPLRNQAGELCPVLIPLNADGSGGFENSNGEGEVTWFQQAFLFPLQHAADRAASRFGWHYIDSNVSFATHGYCSTSSYFVHGSDFIAGKVNLSGVLHPNAAGQRTIADLLYEELAERLLPRGQARKPS